MRLFPAGEPARLAGLASLSAPSPSEPVAALVDIPVVGARSDGKTQFILHAIRTLGADAPDDLPEPEGGATHDIMQVVLAASRPRPDANNPDAGVPHYVFRLRPRKLLDELGLLARIALLARASRLGVAFWLALLGAAAAVTLALVDVLGLATAAGLVWLAGTAAWGVLVLLRRRFLGRGPVEIVFWDVAGENLYGSRQKSADYWSLLRQLVRRRGADARAERPYGFAPVLVCNPLALGSDAVDAPFGRLRALLPIFASLGRIEPRALLVVNRWEAVRGLCPPGADRDELVGVVSEAREAGGAPPLVAVDPSEPLPVVRRGTVQKCCVDAEDGVADGVRVTVLRYDAGICDIGRESWRPFGELEDAVRARWAPPTVPPHELLRYRFTEGPRAFEGEARRVFLRWVAALAFRSGARAPAAAAVIAKRTETEREREREPETAIVAAGPAAPPAAAAGAHTLPMFTADDKAGGFRSGGT